MKIKYKLVKNYLLFIKFVCLLLIIIILNKKKLILLKSLKILSYFEEEKKDYYTHFYSLKSKPLNKNNDLLNKEKKEIMKRISKDLEKNITIIDNIILTVKLRFGNLISLLNKFIFYCEIIGCKSIVLDKNRFWFIKKKIFLKANNITIEVGDISKYTNNSDTIIYKSRKFYYYFFNIKPEIRIHLLRNEILNNLPLIKSSNRDLYIHIRSGDIFTISNAYSYSQPPFCFYKNILNSFNFTQIFLISSNQQNPVIKKLINKYKIIYNKNSLKEDISLLINAYNIVGSISSFLISIIQLNYKLLNFWEYNLYKIIEKYRHFHYDLYKFPFSNFTIYRMEPSNIYIDKMKKWKNNKIQRKLLIKEKCLNNFRIIIKKT